ncbi:MAG: hypothetical protein U5Q03_03415 [Bacteroidota bacterium]|nr:hypothetical protein [Bacteroidota bacterium]
MDHRSKNFNILINSTAFFILAYLFLFVSGHLITIISGSLFDFEYAWYFYRVKFFITRNEWSHDSVKLIFGAVPVYYLIIGCISLIIYSKGKIYEGILKQFFLWLYLIAFSLFFSSLLIGGFTNKGFGHVLRWSYMMDTGRMLYVFTGLTGLISLGYFSARQVLIASNSYYSSMPDKQKFGFYLHMILYPFIAGFLIISLIKIPFVGDNAYYETIILGGFFIVALFMRMRLKFVTELYFEEDDKKKRFNRKLLFTALIILFIYRILLDPGLSPF